VTVGDVASLKKCYVMGGGCFMSPGDFEALRATYTGPVYPYYEYEKIIKYEDERRLWIGKYCHEEQKVRNLRKSIKAMSAKFKAYIQSHP
jgi:hypothetical protein